MSKLTPKSQRQEETTEFMQELSRTVYKRFNPARKLIMDKDSDIEFIDIDLLDGPDKPKLQFLIRRKDNLSFNILLGSTYYHMSSQALADTVYHKYIFEVSRRDDTEFLKSLTFPLYMKYVELKKLIIRTFPEIVSVDVETSTTHKVYNGKSVKQLVFRLTFADNSTADVYMGYLFHRYSLPLIFEQFKVKYQKLKK